VSGTSARVIKQYLCDVHVQRFGAIKTNLCEGKEQKKAAWFTSQAFQGSGAWLVGRTGLLQPPFSFSDADEFVMELRMRLLLSPFSTGNDTADDRVVQCQVCAQTIFQGPDFLHLVDCRLVAGYKNQLHKWVADLLEYHLKKVMGPLGTVGREPVVVGTKRADISFSDGITTVILDVVYATLALYLRCSFCWPKYPVSFI
jgi:hypothetical protein